MFSSIEKLILFVLISLSIGLFLKWIQHFKQLVYHGQGVLNKPAFSTIVKVVLFRFDFTKTYLATPFYHEPELIIHCMGISFLSIRKFF